MNSAPDITDLLQDPILRSLVPSRLSQDAAAATALSGTPTGYLTELEFLKTKLADSAARSDIECWTSRDVEGWHDLTTTSSTDEDCVRTATRYLELRGLLDIHQGNGQLVRLKGWGAR